MRLFAHLLLGGTRRGTSREVVTHQSSTGFLSFLVQQFLVFCNLPLVPVLRPPFRGLLRRGRVSARAQEFVVRLPVQRPVLRPALCLLLLRGREKVALQRSWQLSRHGGEARASSAGADGAGADSAEVASSYVSFRPPRDPQPSSAGADQVASGRVSVRLETHGRDERSWRALILARAVRQHARHRVICVWHLGRRVAAAAACAGACAQRPPGLNPTQHTSLRQHFPDICSSKLRWCSSATPSSTTRWQRVTASACFPSARRRPMLPRWRTPRHAGASQ